MCKFFLLGILDKRFEGYLFFPESVLAKTDVMAF